LIGMWHETFLFCTAMFKINVESSHLFSQRGPSRVRVTKNRNSIQVIDSSHAITGPGI